MEQCPPRQARQRRTRSEIQGIPYHEQRELEKAMRLSLMKMKPKNKPRLKQQKSQSTVKLSVTNPQPPVCLPVSPKIHKVTEPVNKPSPNFIKNDIKPIATKNEGYKKPSRACFKPFSYNTNNSVLIDILSDDSIDLSSSSSDSDGYGKSKSPKKKKYKKGHKRIESTTRGSTPETKKSLKTKTHSQSDAEQVQQTATFSERYSSDTQSSNDVQILTNVTLLKDIKQESTSQSKSSNKRKNKIILLDLSPAVSSSLSTSSLPSSEASSCSMDMILPIDMTKESIKNPNKKKPFVTTAKLKSKKLNKEFQKGNNSVEKKKKYKKKNLSQISSLTKQSTVMQKEAQLAPHTHTDNTPISGGICGPLSTAQTLSTINTDELTTSSTLQHISDVSTPSRPCNEGTVSDDIERSPLSSAFQAQRKFAQNQLRMPIMNTDVSSLSADEFIPPKVPKTEDFLLYLCLKSSKYLPEKLSVFNSPWTPRKSRQRSRLSQQSERIMQPVALAKKSGTRIHF